MVIIVIIGVIVNFNSFNITQDSTNTFNITPFLIKTEGEGQPILVRDSSTVFNVYVYSLEKNLEKSEKTFVKKYV